MPWLTFLRNGEHTHEHTHTSGFPTQQTKSPTRVKICLNVDLNVEKNISTILQERFCTVWQIMYFGWSSNLDVLDYLGLAL